MPGLVTSIERYARFITAAVALLATLFLLALHMDWIRSSADYHLSSWYLLDVRSNYYLATEYADRQSCQWHLGAGQLCKSGSEMVTRELADQKERIDLTNSQRKLLNAGGTVLDSGRR